MGSESEKADPSLQDLGKRCLLIGDGGDDEIGVGLKNLVGFGGLESAMISGRGWLSSGWRLLSLGAGLSSGTTSAQYLVQATTRSSAPTLARITVALGCRQAIRRGMCEPGISIL